MIDREGEDARNGAFILEIAATEQVKTGGIGPSISTEVTVIIEVRQMLNNWLLSRLTLINVNLVKFLYYIGIHMIVMH